MCCLEGRGRGDWWLLVRVGREREERSCSGDIVWCIDVLSQVALCYHCKTVVLQIVCSGLMELLAIGFLYWVSTVVN